MRAIDGIIVSHDRRSITTRASSASSSRRGSSRVVTTTAAIRYASTSPYRRTMIPKPIHQRGEPVR